MHPETGQIYEGTPEQLRDIERARAELHGRDLEKLIPLTSRQANVMKAKTPDERRSIANRVVKNRRKRRANKKNRKR